MPRSYHSPSLPSSKTDPEVCPIAGWSHHCVQGIPPSSRPVQVACWRAVAPDGDHTSLESCDIWQGPQCTTTPARSDSSPKRQKEHSNSLSHPCKYLFTVSGRLFNKYSGGDSTFV